MIDDGSAEVTVKLTSEAELQLRSSDEIDIDFFLNKITHVFSVNYDK